MATRTPPTKLLASDVRTDAAGDIGDLNEAVDLLDDVPDEASEALADQGQAAAGLLAAPDIRRWELMPAHRGKRLDRLLADLVPEHSRSHLQTLIEDGAVTLDDVPVTSPSKKVLPGQMLGIHVRPTAQSQSFKPEAMPLEVLHEDAHLLVINKPAGLVVHPAAGHWQGTLMNGLLAHHAGASALPRAGIVHRLDKDTSGLMVVAKSWEAMHALTQAIAERTVSRQYLAIAHGEWSRARHIDAPVGRDPVSRVRMAVVSQGKPAQTDVLPVAVAGGSDGEGSVSAVRCILHTGRTHQIRVHLAHQGCPLVGDATYGGRPLHGLTRQALHAARLSFRHPMTGSECVFTAPLPEDMAAFFAALGWVAPDFSSWSASGA
ncbi:RluA family pseudouridine synthase [Aquabacterium sp. A3]|uniref:RluA family pseudouridine synthase n=1 Tax=Aquabacterium sp. A3 TaxID=3132829 RepID=UPI00311A1497